MVVWARMAVASFAAATGPLALVVVFLADFLEGLLLIRDFLVIAMVGSPQGWNLSFFTLFYIACGAPNRSSANFFL
jgi:hypothetical protein